MNPDKKAYGKLENQGLLDMEVEGLRLTSLENPLEMLESVPPCLSRLHVDYVRYGEVARKGDAMML